MRSPPVGLVSSSHFPLLTLFGASLVAIGSSAGGSGFQYVSGSYEGQLGCGLILESLVNDGFYAQWEGDIGPALPQNGCASSTHEISVGDPLIGYANVTLSREASAQTPEGSLDIMLHSRIEAEASVGSGLGYWQVAAPDPGVNPSSVAHADARCKELTYEIIGDAGQSIGDPVTVEFNAALTVSHSINGAGYGGPAEVAAYHVSGYLSGEDSLPMDFTVYRRPFDLSTGFVPLLRVNGRPDRTTSIFTRERRQLHVGDQIRIHGGVEPYLNVYHNDEQRGAEVGLYEHAIAEHRFTLNAYTVNETSPAAVVLADDTFATGDLSGWTPHAGMFGMVATEPRLDDPGDVALRLAGQQAEPVQVTKSIECRETVVIQFDYLNLLPFAQLDIRLGGQTLDSLSPGTEGSFQQYQNVFDLADF